MKTVVDRSMNHQRELSPPPATKTKNVTPKRTMPLPAPHTRKHVFLFEEDKKRGSGCCNEGTARQQLRLRSQAWVAVGAHGVLPLNPTKPFLSKNVNPSSLRMSLPGTLVRGGAEQKLPHNTSPQNTSTRPPYTNAFPRAPQSTTATSRSRPPPYRAT